MMLVVAVLAIGFLGPPIERAVNDNVPTPEQMGQTIQVDVPAPVLPLAFQSESAPPVPPPSPTPLPRALVTVAPAQVQVPEGSVRLNPGLAVTLVKDRGPLVDVRFARTNVTVPREAVVATAVQPVTTAARVATFSPVEKIVYAPAASLSVSAHEIGTGRGIEHNWETSYGSYNRDYYSTKGLEVQLRNVSRRETGDCQVSAYWMGRRLKNREVFVHHAEALPTSVDAVSSTTMRFWCPLAPSNVANYVALERRDVQGSKMDGWFVLVSRNGHTMSGVASNPTYQKLLGDSEALKATLASYKPGGRRATSSMPQWRNDPVRDEWRSRRGNSTQ
ncbi:MAG: hypothetical protein QOE70_3273 [Chthoniobacter sp.]|nr:hypothetical protein [Chthoniobacter sp.]